MLYFPEACQISLGPWGPLRADLAAKAPDVRGDTSIRDVLAAACRKRDVLFMDATPVLVEHSGEKLYHRYDTHPTARGYELVAEAVAAQLSQAVADRITS